MMRTAFITGISGAIGRATATAFIARGWSVRGMDVADPPGDLKLEYFLKADVADADSWQRVAQGQSRLDALVNNAAYQIAKPIADTTPEEWDRVQAVTLRSVHLGIRAFHPALIAAQGSIVNVASVHAVATSLNISSYAAAKGGLVAFTRAAALELAAHRVRVNAILPGAVDSAMLDEGLSRVQGADTYLELAKQRLGARTPLGRIGTPHDIAEAIVFFADNDAAGYITGQTLVVDGGATARLSTE